MEDALAHVTDKDWDVSEKVLILVVMEDALALCFKSFNFRNKSLNPCCNGRCTRTYPWLSFSIKTTSLNPCCNGRCTRTIINKI